jgi:hypothetical protein
MDIPDAVRTLERDLREVFGGRLRSLVAYRGADGTAHGTVPTLAVVDGLNADDLRACADRVATWHDSGLDTPLLLAAHEFGRSLDAFPFEFGAILADHALVAGSNPFEGLQVDDAHMRHACEVQARSHLLHLREGFLETRGRGDAIADLVLQSAPGFAALVRSVARLLGHSLADNESVARNVEQSVAAPAGSIQRVVALAGVKSLASDDARRLLPPYIDALEQITNYIDRWSSGGTTERPGGIGPL